MLEIQTPAIVDFLSAVAGIGIFFMVCIFLLNFIQDEQNSKLNN